MRLSYALDESFTPIYGQAKTTTTAKADPYGMTNKKGNGKYNGKAEYFRTWRWLSS